MHELCHSAVAVRGHAQVVLIARAGAARSRLVCDERKPERRDERSMLGRPPCGRAYFLRKRIENRRGVAGRRSVCVAAIEVWGDSDGVNVLRSRTNVTGNDLRGRVRVGCLGLHNKFEAAPNPCTENALPDLRNAPSLGYYPANP